MRLVVSSAWCWPCLRSLHQGIEWRSALGLAERENLPHPGALGGLDGQVSEVSRGDQQPGPALLELRGDVRRGPRRPNRCGHGPGRPDGVHRHRVADRVADEDPRRVALLQAAPGQAARGGADHVRELRPADHGGLGVAQGHRVDERGSVSGLVGQRQDVLSHRPLLRVRAQRPQLGLDARSRTDLEFHQNLPLGATTGGSWPGAGTRPAAVAGLRWFPPPLGNQRLPCFSDD